MKACYELAHFGLDGGAVPLVWSLPVLSELMAAGLVGLAACAMFRTFNLVYFCGGTGFAAALLLALSVLRDIFFCGSGVPETLLELGHVLPLGLLTALSVGAVLARSEQARTAVLGIILLGTIGQGIGAIAQL